MMSEKPFVMPVQTPLGHYIYEVNRNEIITVNSELFNYVQNILNADDVNLIEAPEYIKTQFINLQECGYLQPCRIEKVEHPLTWQVEDLMSRRMDKITLQVTQNCNLRCSYCVYSENSNLGQRSHSSNVMSFETAKKALDFYHDHAIDSELISIGFYGGEPLLAFSLIKEVVAYAEDIFEGKEIIYSITTNATLLNDKIIDYLREKNFNVMISIDGPQEVQDANRKFINGAGSYDVVIKNIRRLYEKDSDAMKRTSVSMVISPSQDYREIVKLFDEPALRNVNLTYTFVEQDAMYMRPNDDYMEKYSYDMFIALVKYFRSDSEQYPSKLVEQDITSYSDGNRRFRVNPIGQVGAPGGPCVPGKIRMLISCFGELYPCERVNENGCMRIGTLKDGINFDQVRSILNIGQMTQQKCIKCWAFSLCTVCAKRADDNGRISVEKKLQACKDAQSIAYNRIMNKILIYENEIHMRKMIKENKFETL